MGIALLLADDGKPSDWLRALSYLARQGRRVPVLTARVAELEAENQQLRLAVEGLLVREMGRESSAV